MAINNITLRISGILAYSIYFFSFLTSIPTYWKIYKKKSTDDFHSLSDIVALFSCMLLLYYSLLKKDDFLLITINSFGCVIETIYLILYIIYAPRAARNLTLKLLSAMNMGSFALIFLVTKYAVHNPLFRVQVLGWICFAVSVGVSGAPLSIVPQVIHTKSVEFMPFNLSFTLTLSALIWFGYGLILKDMYIILQNALSIGLGVFQLVVYGIYWNRARHQLDHTNA